MSHPSRSASAVASCSISVVQPLSGKARDIEAIFRALNMDFGLARINQSPDFQHTIFTHYTRWQNYNLATTTFNSMKQAGTWTLPNLTKTKIIDFFASPSSFYDTIEMPFSAILSNPEYSDMKDWLDSRGKNPPALEVWGVYATSYTIADLKKWIEMGGTLDANASRKKKKQSKSKDKSHKKGSTSKNT